MPIKGVRTRKKLLKSTGKLRFYYYVNRHASERFFESDEIDVQKLAKVPADYAEAYAAARSGLDVAGTWGDAILEYRRSPERMSKAAVTRRDEERYLELLCEIPLKGGRRARNAPLSVFDDPKVAPYLFDWRDSMAATPRKADMAMGVLSRVLDFHCARGRLTSNRAEKIGRLYRAPRDQGEGWTGEELVRFVGDGCPWQLRLAILFMRYTGARRTDAMTLTVGAIKDTLLVWDTSKGRRHGRKAILPILPEARAVLEELDERRRTLDPSPLSILFNSNGKAWTPDGFSSSFDNRRKKLGIKKTIHQLRKSYATDLVLAHHRDPATITRAVVTRAMGWSDDQLDEMVRIYVDDSAVIASMVNKPRPVNGHQADTRPGAAQTKES